MTKHLTDEEFVDVLTSSQVRLAAFAHSLVRPSADADDVLQNACIVLWEKRKEYDADRKFFSWACGVVLFEVLKYRERTTKDKLIFDEDLIRTLASEQVNHLDELDLCRQFLPRCIAKLNESDRSLLEARYDSEVTPKKFSEQRECSASSVYAALTRIRASLYRCIKANLAQLSHPHE